MNVRDYPLDLEQRIDRLFGRLMRSLREETKLSIQGLADRTGFPVEELIDHEAGILPIPLSRLAVLLCILDSWRPPMN